MTSLLFPLDISVTECDFGLRPCLERCFSWIRQIVPLIFENAMKLYCTAGRGTEQFVESELRHTLTGHMKVVIWGFRV